MGMANEKKRALLINANRTGYNPDQVHSTFTIGELICALEEMADAYGGDAEVFLSHDNGYTYGGIGYDDLQMAKYDDDRVYLTGDEYDMRW